MATADFFNDICRGLRESGNLRTIPAERRNNGLVDFSANDYIGFSRFSFREIAAEYPELTDAPMTSSASRLLASVQREYGELEDLIGRLYGFGRKALVFNSGYHANTGIVSALAAIPGSIVIADRLVHASIIDGLKEVRSRVRFPHNNLDRLEEILRKEEKDHPCRIVIVESVYSMDGDSPDLERLIDIKRRYPGTILYVDEAHAFGACGPHGLGLTMETSAPEEFDIVVATLGKALGSYGAFAVTSGAIRDFLVNKSRSFIFSTSLPPMNIVWSRIMIEKMLGADAERAHLRNLGKRLYDGLQEIKPDCNRAASHIGYLTTGDPVRAVSLSESLREDGLIVLPIRTPTVPPGTDRLRISLSSAMTEKDIDRLISAIKKRI